MVTTPPPPPPAESTLGFLGTWARIGLLGFGGPAGQIALMHKVVVEEKSWLEEARFLAALNFCMLLPGPEAQQLATYCGWVKRGIWGGLAAGLLFVLPGALIMLALSLIYVTLGAVPLVDGLFFGIKAVVLGLVIEALLRIARRALVQPYHWAMAAIAFVALFFLNVPFPWVIGVAGLIGFALNSPIKSGESIKSAAPFSTVSTPAANRLHPWHRTLLTGLLWLILWLGPLALAGAFLGPDHVLSQIGLFFARMAVVTFGGAYAVLAYVAQEAVSQYGWLTAPEMLKGLGLAETTPGPLVLVLQFVGFLAAYRDAAPFSALTAGLLGAGLTSWLTFAPSFLWIFMAAPYLDWIRQQPRLQGALAAITASVVGVILNLSLWFGLHVLFAEVAVWRWGPVHVWAPAPASLDPAALTVSTLAIIALFRWKVGLLPTLLGGAILGAALRLAGFAG